jgi:hypothetical protein
MGTASPIARAIIRQRYAEEIAKAMPLWSGTPAVWGKDDCALALANIDVIVIGRDPAEPYRGHYRSARGAKRVLGKAGLLGAWGKAARRLGWRRLKITRTRAKVDVIGAADGDRAVAVTPAGVSTVIRYRGRWIGRSDYGNLMVSNNKIIRAWSVA